MKTLKEHLNEALKGDMKFVNKWINQDKNITSVCDEIMHKLKINVDNDIIHKLFEWIAEDLDQYDSIISLTSHIMEDGPTNFEEWLDDQYNIPLPKAPWDEIFKIISHKMETEI